MVGTLSTHYYLDGAHPYLAEVAEAEVAEAEVAEAEVAEVAEATLTT